MKKKMFKYIQKNLTHTELKVKLWTGKVWIQLGM